MVRVVLKILETSLLFGLMVIALLGVLWLASLSGSAKGCESGQPAACCELQPLPTPFPTPDWELTAQRRFA